MARLICLGGGIEGLPILQRARALGHDLIVVDGNPKAPGMVLGRPVVASCYDPHETVLRLAGVQADGVICCAIDAPHVAAAVAAAFGLPGLTPERAFRSVNKPEQKRILSSVVDVPSMMRWPRIVVKPPDSRGARGVRLLDTGGVVEEYLDGPQLSTESIIQDGKVLFTAIGLRNYSRLAEFAPYVIEDGYDMPYSLPPLTSGWKNLDSMLATACQALGWDNLTVKGDWIIHDGKLVILELAARLSGGFFGTHGIPLAYNFPFVDVAIELALGYKQGDVAASFWLMPPGPYVSQRYVFPEPGDIGRRVAKMPTEIRTTNQYGLTSDFLTFAIHPGDTIQPVTSHGQRWGQVTCTGATPEQARERAERAVAAMKAAVVLD